jgi:hypothetical protein
MNSYLRGPRLLMLLVLACFLMLASPAGAATSTSTSTSNRQAYPTNPVTKPDGSRWRVGYLQSGDYRDYPLTWSRAWKSLAG